MMTGWGTLSGVRGEYERQRHWQPEGDAGMHSRDWTLSHACLDMTIIFLLDLSLPHRHPFLGTTPSRLHYPSLTRALLLTPGPPIIYSGKLVARYFTPALPVPSRINSYS
jgi:hypothetical protein